jgi:hypothetical protein
VTSPPSKSDIATFNRELSDWISVDKCEGLVTDFQLAHGNFARGLRGGKLWKECFHAVRFARAAHAKSLRIGSDPPDFEFRTAGGCIPVELVVARDIDDSTSQQFLQRTNFIGPTRPSVELVGDIALKKSWEGLPNRIAQRVDAKSKKGYPSSFVLAVAASTWWWTDEQSAMERAIKQSCQPFSQSFADIWILAGSHFISLKDVTFSD